MICAKCHRPIRPGEKYTAHDVHSPSAGGITVRIHANCGDSSRE